MTALFEDGELAEAPAKLLTDALAAYNEVAGAVNLAMKSVQWRVAKGLISSRKKKLKAAIADYGGIHAFKVELQNAAKNDFLMGKEGRTGAHRDWRPDLDFFCQPKTITKILEGAWPPSEPIAKRLYVPTGLTTPKQAPAEPFVPEPREVRLAAMIVTFRKLERWDKANEIESQLAALEGRPAVLVPAPDVAHFGMPGKSLPPDQADKSGFPAPSGRARADLGKSLPPVTDIEWTDDIPEGATHDADD